MLSKSIFVRNCKAWAIQTYHKPLEFCDGVGQTRFVEAYITKEIEKYDSAKDEKMKQIIEHITNNGYEKISKYAPWKN